MIVSIVGAAGVASSVCCASPRSALPAAPGVRSIVDTAFYDAEARERRQWMAAMRASARRAGVTPPYVAYTRTQTSWRYTSSSGSAGCEARVPVVELTIRYIMPRLVADTVDEDDMLEWRRYMVSLWRHEEGHAARALREAAEMRDSLTNVHASSCATLSAAATRALEAVSRKYSRLQREYDERTGHGARQGAVLLMPGANRLAIDTTYRDSIP